MHVLNAKSIPTNFHSPALHCGYIHWYCDHSNHLYSSLLTWRAQCGTQPRWVLWPSPLVKRVHNTEAGVAVTAFRDPDSSSL